MSTGSILLSLRDPDKFFVRVGAFFAPTRGRFMWLRMSSTEQLLL